MSIDKSTKKSLRLALIITGSTFLFVIIFIGIGILIPILMSPGTQNYTGVKLKATQVALEEDAAVAQEVYNPFTTQRVVKIELTPPDTRNGGIICATDPTLYNSYIVTIQRITFFGIPVHQAAVSNCRAA